MIIYSGLIVLAYLLGSVTSAVVVCRLMGLGDPRTTGSGNPGATNVLRLHGKGPAAITLAGDVLKGLLPVAAAKLLDAPPLIVALTGLAAFSGHLFPVFYGFQGGKGVATFIGVLSATHWLLGVLFAGTWLLMAALSRFASLSSLTAAALAPLYTWLILPEPAFIVCFILMALILFWRHRENMMRLLAGTEKKIGKNPA